MTGVAGNDRDPGPFDFLTHPKKRAFCIAYSLTGAVGRAEKIAGISHGTIYTDQWAKDPDFVRGMELARRIAANQLEAEARRRAVEGNKAYKFTKDGDSIRNPAKCVCAHGPGQHGDLPQPNAWDLEKMGPWEGRTKGPCLDPDCACPGFLGEPYYEHATSDTLLIFLMKGNLPERYADRVEVRGGLAHLDLTKLPDHLLARIAGGEHPGSVMAEVLEKAKALHAGGGVEGRPASGELVVGEPEE